MLLIVGFVIAFASTIGPICWIYLAEIMTEKGMSIAVSLNWMVVILMSYLPTLAKQFNHDPDESNQRDLSIFFFLFSGFCIAGFFLISLYVKETKGLNPLEIMTLYKNKEYDPLTQN
jgi:preprotein translocase subunit SecY